MESTDENPLAIKSFLEELCASFGKEFIVIGGWAVYSYNARNLTFDGVAVISYEVQGCLRDSYAVTKNARMKKEQFVGPTGHDIDLYVERQHGLPVDYGELHAYAKQRADLWVACPEHLITLKLEAARDRQGSPKGEKDKLDILALLSLPDEEFANPELLAKHLDDEKWASLRRISQDTQATGKFCRGNEWDAKNLRKALSAKLEMLRATGEYNLSNPPTVSQTTSLVEDPKSCSDTGSTPRPPQSL
jgi:hypothetical protein